MTDRHAGYVVVLDQLVHEDDAQATLNAIRQIKGVIAVEPVIFNGDLHIAEERAKHTMRTRISEMLRTLYQDL